MAGDENLLTLDEAAQRLGVHYMTVYRYVRLGRLPAEKVGRTWQVAAADLRLLAEPADAPSVRSTPSRRAAAAADAASRFEARILAGDEGGAWGVLEESLVNGLVPGEVLVDVVAGALAAVGDGWERGELSVAEEHRATAVAARVIARLGPRFARRGPARGLVVLGAPSGDHHALPTAIVRDLLRGEHFEVVDLGGDVPAAAWAEAVGRAEADPLRLVAVGVAVSSPGNDVAVAEAIAAIRSATSAPIVLGGMAADGLELIVDRVSGSAADAVQAVVALAETTPADS